MWEPDTDDNDCGLLESVPDGVNFHHTPNTSGMDGGSNSRRALARRQANWATPRANSAMASAISPEVAFNAKRFPNLETQVGKSMLKDTDIINLAKSLYPDADGIEVYRNVKWPSPTCSDVYTGNLKSTQQKPGSMHSVTLPQAVAMWPTPVSSTGGANHNSPSRQGDDATGKINLAGMVAIHESWPTPTSHLAKETGAASEYGRDTPSLVSMMFESPDHRNGMALNPDWVEWLMGWPVGMTSLKPLSKEIFDDWQKKSKLGRFKKNAKNVSNDGMSGMQSNENIATASCGQEQIEHSARKHNDTLPGLSLCRTHESRGLGSSPSEASHLQDMQYRVSAEAFAPSESMQSDMSKRNGAYFGNEAVGLWDLDPADTGEVPRVTDVKENRANRLKAIGNGQVPQCVVKAWELLS